MKNKVIIIGSRSTGLALSYYLKPEIKKIYLGKGFAYENLEETCYIIVDDDKKKVFSADRIYKGNEECISSSEDIFIAVRDPDLKALANRYENLLKDKNIYVLTSTNSGFNEFKAKLNNSSVVHTIFLNGINYLSPALIQIVGRPNKINFLTKNDNYKNLNLNLSALLRKNFFQIIDTNTSSKELNNLLFKRYAKSLLSLLCLKYKVNVGEIIRSRFSEYDILLEELILLLDVNTEVKENLIFDIIHSNDILGYYTSYFLNKYLRFKTDNEWLYFIKDLNSLIKLNDSYKNLKEFLKTPF